MSSNLSVKILLKDGRLADARVTEDDNFEEVLFLLHIDSKQIIITIKLKYFRWGFGVLGFWGFGEWGFF